MAHWLFKTEPSTYAYADLVHERRAVWDGITNPAALMRLRTVKKGDVVVLYHTGDEKAAVGLAEVTRAPYPDPKLPADVAAKRVVVDLKPVRAFPVPVPLADFRTDPVLKTTELVRITRLSVVPLSPEQFARVLERAGARA